MDHRASIGTDSCKFTEQTMCLRVSRLHETLDLKHMGE